MADVHGKEARSRNMRAIRHKDTKAEVWLRSQLQRRGFRFRKNDRRYPGKPDIVLPKYKAVILFNGCFWHRHDCHLFKLPATRADFWNDKINGNVERDKRNLGDLEELGFRVLIVWECVLKGKLRLTETEVLETISDWIKNGLPSSSLSHSGLSAIEQQQ